MWQRHIVRNGAGSALECVRYPNLQDITSQALIDLCLVFIWFVRQTKDLDAYTEAQVRYKSLVMLPSFKIIFFLFISLQILMIIWFHLLLFELKMFQDYLSNPSLLGSDLSTLESNLWFWFLFPWAVRIAYCNPQFSFINFRVYLRTFTTKKLDILLVQTEKVPLLAVQMSFQLY